MISGAKHQAKDDVKAIEEARKEVTLLPSSEDEDDGKTNPLPYKFIRLKLAVMGLQELRAARRTG